MFFIQQQRFDIYTRRCGKRNHFSFINKSFSMQFNLTKFGTPIVVIIDVTYFISETDTTRRRLKTSTSYSNVSWQCETSCSRAWKTLNRAVSFSGTNDFRSEFDLASVILNTCCDKDMLSVITHSVEWLNMLTLLLSTLIVTLMIKPFMFNSQAMKLDIPIPASVYSFNFIITQNS